MPEKISQILDLAKIDVFRETELNNNLYFNIIEFEKTEM